MGWGDQLAADLHGRQRGHSGTPSASTRTRIGNTGRTPRDVQTVIRATVAALTLLSLLAGCGTIAPAAPQVVTVTAQPAVTADPSAAADRTVCVDLDARGGALYNVLVVPMMSGGDGRKTIDVNVAQMTRAAAQVEQVGRGLIDESSPAIADAAQRLVTSAGALGVYEHADSTALLTSFVTLAVECEKAGHKPSWFDAAALAQS